MASIQNLRLKITEVLGRARAEVTYTLIGSAVDIEDEVHYFEFIDLIGVDTRPGEDGVDELIPGGRFVQLLTFPLQDPQRRHVFQLPSSALDEDRSVNPDVAFPIEDEIRARVTLRPSLQTAGAESNVVKRGGLISTPFLAVPA